MQPKTILLMLMYAKFSSFDNTDVMHPATNCDVNQLFTSLFHVPFHEINVFIYNSKISFERIKARRQVDEEIWLS